ncbi:methionine aminopeptidase [Scopulibacillus cellulosilyticus]|uniref:Methionine aminopeptidase n=1 Tax=Scopulibacillus cellulosilyticus TaxID=2665665 RepID=A0ABW2Q0F0_9BACL
MGLFNAISNWKSERHGKHVSQMRALGRCPDCNGKGFTTLFNYEFSAPLDCQGCNGSGLYSDWAKNNEIDD